MTAHTQPQVQPADTTDGQKHVRGIASDVILDRRDGVAIKMYRRNRFIETLYHVAFQAKFPYVDNRAALKASQYRRKIAGLITKYFLGEDVVTPVVAVERVDGRYRFVTELVKGGEPNDHHKARVFLNEVTQAFIKCGLPTWQVSPHNPRSLGNVMETEDGHYRIIDLESNVVTPMVPVTRLWTSAREAHLPPFDDIDLLKLWTFINENWDSLQESLGEEDAHQLVAASAKYAWYERLWHGEEPRLWSRALRGLTRLVDIPGHLRAIAHRISGWSNNVAAGTGWLESGIDRWVAEGRLSQEQSARAKQDMESAQTIAVLAHLGAHLTMNIPLRFPLGATARFLWTLSFRMRAELRAAIHRHADEETRRARAVHSLPVMAAAALPGIGSASYVLAAPLRNNRILMAVAIDHALQLLPLHLYRRLHLSGVTGGLITESRKQTPEGVLAGARSLVVRGLRELRTLPAALMPMLGAALIVVGAWVYLAITGNHDAVGEFGVVASAKLALSLVAAGLGIAYFRSFWRTSEEATEGAAATLFWLGAGLGAAWVAADDYFSIHEAVIDVVPHPDFLDFAFENADKVAQAAYLGLATIALRVFWGPINCRPGAALLAATALVLGAGALGVDALTLGGSDWAALEESLHLLAVGAISSAIVLNQLELSRRAVR